MRPLTRLATEPDSEPASENASDSRSPDMTVKSLLAIDWHTRAQSVDRWRRRIRVKALLREVAWVLCVWMGLIAAVELVAFVATRDPNYGVEPKFEDMLYHFIGPAKSEAPMCRWDCAWYVAMAERGYPGPDTAAHDVAFFPLFGLAIRAVERLFHLKGSFAAVWISRVSLLGTLFSIRRLARISGARDQQDMVVQALLITPNAFVLLAGYADGLFLFLSLAAFVLALERRFTLASVFAFGAGLTRLHAAGLVVGLLVIGAREAWLLWKRERSARGLLALVPAIACAAGIGCVLLYLRRTTGDALAFVHEQPWFGKPDHATAFDAYRTSINVFRKLWPPGGIADLYWLLVGAWMFVWWAVLLTLAFKRRWTMLAYAAAVYALVWASGTHWGALRYMTIVFPTSFAIAELSRHRSMWIVVTLLGVMIQTLMLVQFVTLRGPGP